MKEEFSDMKLKLKVALEDKVIMVGKYKIE